MTRESTQLHGGVRCLTLFYSLTLLLHASPLQSEEEERIAAPDYLVELYHKFNTGIGEVEEEEKNANKIYTIYRGGKTEWEDFYLPQKAKLVFNISSFEKNDNVLASNLRVFVDDLVYLSPSTEEHGITALTLRTTCRTRIYNREDVLLVTGRIWRHTKQLKVSDTGQWIKIKVSSIERTLNNLHNYRQLYHFEVRCVVATFLARGILDKYGGRTPILSIQRSKEPTLVVYVTDHSSKPFRELMEGNQRLRQLEQSAGGAGGRAGRGFDHRCVRRDFYMNFKKLGWDKRIIHPAEINIYQCAGHCPFPLSSAIDHSTNALMRAAWYNKFPDEVSKPCCVATTFKPHSMILNRGNDVVYKTFDDIIVTQCKCL